jgi:hypothetical protein
LAVGPTRILRDPPGGWRGARDLGALNVLKENLPAQ